MSVDEQVLGLCLGELDRRERTVVQMRRRLERAGTPAEAIEAALAWLIERGRLDDAGFAARFAEDRRHLDGWGTDRIRRRLEELGVGPEAIAAGVGERGVGEELEAALAVLDARLRGGGARDDRERRRALGLLARRGYEPEVAEDAVRRHFDRRPARSGP